MFTAAKLGIISYIRKFTANFLSAKLKLMRKSAKTTSVQQIWRHSSEVFSYPHPHFGCAIMLTSRHLYFWRPHIGVKAVVYGFSDGFALF